MPAPTTISILFLAALGLVFIPGPAVLFIMTRSAEGGRRAGAVSALGIGAADVVHTTAAALGLSALLMTSALAFGVVKYLGAAYLLYLGVRTLMRRDAHPQPSHQAESRTQARMFFQGMTFELLNPKTALFFLAFLPQFIDPARGTITVQFLFFGTMFAMLGLVSLTFYGLLSGTIATLLKRNARFQRVHRYVTGGIYILCAENGS